MNRDEVFDLLDRLAHGIAEMFGASCETIIHDFSLPSHPVLAIYNGHVSNRAIGSTLDLMGLEQQVAFEGDVINLLATTVSGQQIKSSTFSIEGDDYHYGLGINFDFTALSTANRTLLDLICAETDFHSAVYRDQDTGLSDLFDSCVNLIGKPIREMNKTDRLRVMTLLKQNGALSYRRAMPYIATRLCVSRYTVYKYLDEVTQAERSKGRVSPIESNND